MTDPTPTTQPTPREARPGDPPHDTAARYFNRDLSWLEFNARVLSQALDERTPLLERVKFVAIFSSNLDEYFMKRVGLLKSRIRAGSRGGAPGVLSPATVMEESRTTILRQVAALSACWGEDLIPALATQGVEVLDYDTITDHERAAVDDWFRLSVFPILTPLAVDPGHRFPFISNLSNNLGVLLRAPGEREHKFARVKVPDVIQPFVRVDSPGAPFDAAGPCRLLPLVDLISHNLEGLFPGLEILEVLPFRVTRSAVPEIDDDDADDLLELVEAELRSRRFAAAVRLQIGPNPSHELVQFLLKELELEELDVYTRTGPLDYTSLFRLADLPFPGLKDEPWTPVHPAQLLTRTGGGPGEPVTDLFARIREGDVLLHHPYDSFEHAVERFIDEAASDPDVLAIKQTLYRTSRGSPFVDSLIRAAEDGKQVACLVELRARFDEEKNVSFARQLEDAGVHVAYGVVGLKTHCKCSLVIRREHDEHAHPILRAYAHIGTGNYHPHTAQLYTDLGVLTADPEVTADIVKLFNTLTGHAADHDFARLLVAPQHMRAQLTELIDAEIANAHAGRPARIIAKMNSFEDRKLTEKLYEASAAGVKVDLIVRGFCSLRPAVPGLSDNITVRSIIGRFLEHSRVFVFLAGAERPEDAEYIISSADWMYRNLNNRVEAALPVADPAAKQSMWRILDIMLRDQRRAWTLRPDGSYLPPTVPDDAPPNSPEALGAFQTLMLDADPARMPS